LQVVLILLTTPFFVAVLSVWLLKRKVQPFLYPAIALSIAASTLVSCGKRACSAAMGGQ
jgi:drug/metabolite transporter (DMT)-like permease